MTVLEAAEPTFLAERRARGAQAAGTLPLPHFRGTPGWEFTPIDDIDLDAFVAAPGGDVATVAEPLFAFDGATTVDDTAEATSEGPIVLPLAVAAERYPELVEKHLGTVVHESIITARNDALWSEGAFVYVPRGVTVEAPVLLTSVHEEAGSALYHRTLVVLEEGAEAEVWDQTLSADAKGKGLINGVVELVVGANARLRYVGAQDVSEKTWVFGAQRATVARDGNLDWIVLGFGSKNGKVFLETELAGPGAHAKVTGAYATEGRQHLDFDTLQTHAAPNCVSDLAFRGIITGRSSAVWRGMIKVEEGAQQTDGFQECRNLLIGKKAHADAIPGLEILADDVRCTHAAAIAQVDPDQIFYLRARGLSETSAHRLVVEGFLQALVERFADGPLHDAVAGALERRLERVLG